MRDQVAAALNQHVECFYPRTVDSERGGFHQTFRRNWSQVQDQGKFVVFQARMTWFAANVALFQPERAPELIPIIRHGVHALENLFLDQENGGFKWMVDFDGIPVGASKTEKHLYGHAFALYALSAAARATGDAATLELAKNAFTWLNTAGWDHEYGGARECTTASGEPIATDNYQGRERDLLGSKFGGKAQNTQLHILEALTELVKVWPDPAAIARLLEMVEIGTKTMRAERGFLHVFFNRDWSPASNFVSAGHDIEAAFLLLDAAKTLTAAGVPTDVTTDAIELLDLALEFGWDKKNGGLYDAVSPDGVPFYTDKIWWIQAESFGALALGHSLTGNYAEKLQKQWDFIQNSVIDHQFGGWFQSVSDDGAEIRHDDKANSWKAAYHDGRALMTALNVLPS
ncbi:MAG: AGE family epimerase/isomerase [Fimbriimonas sp.]